MKKIILLLLIVSLNSCSKEYTRNYPCQVPTNNMTAINLDNFTFYKREIYYKNDLANNDFIKTQSKIDSSYIRYEVQIMGIEKNWNSKNLKNVIYFSYIPPYYFEHKIIYQFDVYDRHPNLINLNNINYIQFGKLDKSNRISFVKGESISIWDYSSDINNVSIDNVSFFDRVKTKTLETKQYLKNKAIYNLINNPDIILFNYLNEKDYNNINANYLKNNTLYYDKTTNNFYFEFNEKLKMRKVKKGMDYIKIYPETWIMYDCSRVRANYVE